MKVVALDLDEPRRVFEGRIGFPRVKRRSPLAFIKDEGRRDADILRKIWREGEPCDLIIRRSPNRAHFSRKGWYLPLPFLQWWPGRGGQVGILVSAESGGC
jgi:hypothetical protein